MTDLVVQKLSLIHILNGKTQYKFIQILDRFEIKDDFGTKKRTKRNYNVHLSKVFILPRTALLARIQQHWNISWSKKNCTV